MAMDDHHKNELRMEYAEVNPPGHPSRSRSPPCDKLFTAPMETSLLRRQPIKGFYIGYVLFSAAFVRLPWWCIRYAVRGFRPRPSWTLKRCIIVAGYREIITYAAARLGLRNNRSHPISDDELKNAKFVWIDGVSEESDTFCGEIRRAASITGVRPAQVPAYWIYKPGTTIMGELKAKGGERTVLHIHGGAFHLGSAHPDEVTSNLSHGLLAHSHTLERILAVDYRLSAATPDTPANPFPAALLDCVAAYQYLVNDLSFEPKNITIAGDSAGGSLAFALVRYLVENSIPGLPIAGRLLSCSAWLDLSEARRGPDTSRSRNFHSDILGMRSDYPHRAYQGALDTVERTSNRYISPVSPHIEQVQGIFKGFPRTYISAGGAELILDDSTIVVERMKTDGVDVMTDIEADAIHDYMIFTWHEPERTEGLKRACRWLDD